MFLDQYAIRKKLPRHVLGLWQVPGTVYTQYFYGNDKATRLSSFYCIKVETVETLGDRIFYCKRFQLVVGDDGKPTRIGQQLKTNWHGISTLYFNSGSEAVAHVENIFRDKIERNRR